MTIDGALMPWLLQGAGKRGATLWGNIVSRADLIKLFAMK